MNDNERVWYELGYRHAQIQGLLDSIERKLDQCIESSQRVLDEPKPEPPTNWWNRLLNSYHNK